MAWTQDEDAGIFLCRCGWWCCCGGGGRLAWFQSTHAFIITRRKEKELIFAPHHTLISAAAPHIPTYNAQGSKTYEQTRTTHETPSQGVATYDAAHAASGHP